MVLGEKIKDPLNHEIREILLNIILRHKRTGIRLVELSKITGKKNHSLRHHLDILEKKKLVYTKSTPHQLYYYPDSHIPKHTRIGHPLENELRSKMLETIVDGHENGIHVGVLYRKLKISKNRTLKSLHILKHFKLIDMQHGENKIFCYPTPKTQDLVKYIKDRKSLLEAIMKEDGILLQDLEEKMDISGLDHFKLCVYSKRNGPNTLFYVTPFVERLLERYGSVS